MIKLNSVKPPVAFSPAFIPVISSFPEASASLVNRANLLLASESEMTPQHVDRQMFKQMLEQATSRLIFKVDHLDQDEFRALSSELCKGLKGFIFSNFIDRHNGVFSPPIDLKEIMNPVSNYFLSLTFIESASTLSNLRGLTSEKLNRLRGDLMQHSLSHVRKANMVIKELRSELGLNTSEYAAVINACESLGALKTLTTQ